MNWLLAVLICAACAGVSACLACGCSRADRPADGSLVFIHHSCGQQWLDRPSRWPRRPGLHKALLAKDYIGKRNDITYGVKVEADEGRPDSLAPVAGDKTDMCHWILWFNDYLGHVKAHGQGGAPNKIVMFKSCYPLSCIASDGPEPGDPFDGALTLANYKALYRHPEGPGKTYERDGVPYKPLEDVFAENPDTLFIPVTSPPRHYGPEDKTTDDAGRRARTFNNWLKGEWLAAYKAKTGLGNVAVFDWFDVLANPDDHPAHPNRLREEYGGGRGDSHPGKQARIDSTRIFATNKDNFIDAAWRAFGGADGG